MYYVVLISNLLLSSGKATGGRRAPSTLGRKVISPVTMWLQQTPYRLKSKNSHNCLSKHSIFASLCHPTTFISTSIYLSFFFSCPFLLFSRSSPNLVFLWLRQNAAAGWTHNVTNPSCTHGRESKQWSHVLSQEPMAFSFLFFLCDRNIVLLLHSCGLVSLLAVGHFHIFTYVWGLNCSFKLKKTWVNLPNFAFSMKNNLLWLSLQDFSIWSKKKKKKKNSFLWLNFAK